MFGALHFPEPAEKKDEEYPYAYYSLHTTSSIRHIFFALSIAYFLKL